MLIKTRRFGFPENHNYLQCTIHNKYSTRTNDPCCNSLKSTKWRARRMIRTLRFSIRRHHGAVLRKSTNDEGIRLEGVKDCIRLNRSLSVLFTSTERVATMKGKLSVRSVSSILADYFGCWFMMPGSFVLLRTLLTH
jgi:hypothetical protein